MKTPRLTPILDGSSDHPTLFFVQGWPDDHTLWNDLVAGLTDRYRCVRVDMPNYERAEFRRWGYDHEAMAEGLSRCIREVSPERPVTVIGHDWGAYWTYLVHHRHPELVQRIVGLDIAPHMHFTPRELALVVGYQFWLAGAFVCGGALGDGMTRVMARILKSPKQGKEVRAGMNYPYLYNWRDIATGHNAKMFRKYWPEIPILYIYGQAKPGQFHSQRWLDFVKGRPENRVVALDGTGHWVTEDPRLLGVVREWLDTTAAGLR